MFFRYVFCAFIPILLFTGCLGSSKKKPDSRGQDDLNLRVEFYTWEDWAIVRPTIGASVSEQVLSKDVFRHTTASLVGKRKTAQIVWDKRALPNGVTEVELKTVIEAMLVDQGYEKITFERAISTERDQDGQY